MCPGTDSIAFHLWSFSENDLKIRKRPARAAISLMVSNGMLLFRSFAIWTALMFQHFLLSHLHNPLYFLSVIEISLNLNTGESQLLLIKWTLRILLKDKNVDRLKDSVILRDEGLKNICGSPELCSSFSVVLQPFPTAMIMPPSGLRK